MSRPAFMLSYWLYVFIFILSNLVECLLQVGQQVVDVLGADAESHGTRRDVLGGEFVGRHLRMRGGVGMDDETLDVGHVGEEGENVKVVDEAPCGLLSAVNLEGEDGGCSLWVVALVEGVVGVRGQAGMVDLEDLGVLLEEVDHTQCVLHVALDTERERFESL